VPSWQKKDVQQWDWKRAIKSPRTRSAAARQVSNAYERDLATNENIQFRPLLSQTYLLESLFLDPVRSGPGDAFHGGGGGKGVG